MLWSVRDHDEKFYQHAYDVFYPCMKCLSLLVRVFTPGCEQRGEHTPRVQISPLGAKFAPGVNTLYCLEEWRGKQIISPPMDNLTPRGQNSPLGDNFTPGGQVHPRGEVKNGPQNFWNEHVNWNVDKYGLVMRKI
jgi:hypothetical protein